MTSQPEANTKPEKDSEQSVAAKLLDDLGVVYDGAEANHRAALPHRLLHHFDGTPDSKTEAHLVGADDLH